MDYTPLQTVSGTPAFSTEQREYYNKKQQQIKDTMGDFCFLDPDFKRLPFLSRFFDYNLFLKLDIKPIGTHPIHLYMLTLKNFYMTYNEKIRELYIKREMNEIDEEEYNKQITDLNNKKLLADAEFDLSIKRKLKIKKL